MSSTMIDNWSHSQYADGEIDIQVDIFLCPVEREPYFPSSIDISFLDLECMNKVASEAHRLLNHQILSQVPQLKSTSDSSKKPLRQEDSTKKADVITNNVGSSNTDIKFACQFSCSYCVLEYDENCIHHTCLICSQQADGFNSVLCQACTRSIHISCMDLPIVNLIDQKWICKECLNGKAFGDGSMTLGYTTGKIHHLEVGSLWKYRLDMTANYLHRPSMGGISGNCRIPAYSIVLQGGFKSDFDYGEDFYYTGSGGKDKSNIHFKDQVLETGNLSLAMTCDTKLNQNGGTALDWTKSSPVRVIRGFKLKRFFPRYAPQAGFRYDGIYKLVRYWREKMPDGYYLWRYYFRRDDPVPAPWYAKEPSTWR